MAFSTMEHYQDAKLADVNRRIDEINRRSEELNRRSEELSKRNAEMEEELAFHKLFAALPLCHQLQLRALLARSKQ